MNNLYRLIICSAILVSTLSMSAQGPKDGGKDWRERIMSEKIAYLTNAVGLTPEEAQAFWPVYNQTWDERGKAQFAVMKAYRELEKATDENRTKDIPALLDAYLEAIRNRNRTDEKCEAQFRKVLPIEKVAKLYIGEERFRRQQIHNLHHGKK
jgi:hypothetical protein